MEKTVLESGLGYNVYISGGLPDLNDILEAGCFLTADSNVADIYPELVKNLNPYIIPAGERSKTMAAAEEICKQMLSRGLTRKNGAAALGGGVTGDLTGFAAGIYMRGVKITHIPTTLLAMCDSATGGKTGVNLGGVKNCVGVFNRPAAVHIYTGFLKTLPPREKRSGLGEIIKTAMLDAGFWKWLKVNVNNVKAGEENALTEAVTLSVKHKLRVTGADERESGLRKQLNAGHTVGHALESLDGYRLSHGEYVTRGLVMEARMFPESVPAAFISEVEEMCGSAAAGLKFTAGEISAAAAHDKKNEGGRLSVMSVTAPGEVAERLLLPKDFEERLKNALKP